MALAQPGDQLQHLPLHGHVERGGRLVGDQELRLVGDRHRDHHALLLPAGKLVRIGAQPRARLWDADLRQELRRSLERSARAHAAVELQHFRHLLADREHGIERAHRLLEHRGDLAPAQRAQAGLRHAEQVLAAIEHPTRRMHYGVLRQQPQNRHRRDGLAATRLADERERRIRTHGETDAAHRFNRSAASQAERNTQILDGDQRAHRNFGSSASRRLSVNMENAVRKIAMNTVAAASCHHLPMMSSVWASDSIVPHDTMSTGTPSPRKERITSTLMKATTRSESCTRITWLTFGRMCTNMREAAEAPIACAASTYSRERCFMYSARTRRYMPVQPVTERMITTVQMPLAKRSAKAPLLSTAASEKMSRMYGIEVKTL